MLEHKRVGLLDTEDISARLAQCRPSPVCGRRRVVGEGPPEISGILADAGSKGNDQRLAGLPLSTRVE
eukprot:15445809-Alexandrium_andersonii.AAC.1